MPPPPQIDKIVLAPSASGSEAAVTVCLQDGTCSRFMAAQAGRPASWIDPRGFAFRGPVLFVSELEAGVIREAAERMAEDMGGWWLRYYNTP